MHPVPVPLREALSAVCPIPLLRLLWSMHTWGCLSIYEEGVKGLSGSWAWTTTTDHRRSLRVRPEMDRRVLPDRLSPVDRRAGGTGASRTG